MIDHKKLAVIHIVKKELGFSDAEYRDFLEKSCGVRSAKELDEISFRVLMREFAKSRHYRLNPDGLTIRQKLYILHLVEELGWSPNHFNNFLDKYYHKTDIDNFSKGEASRLIESLKQVKKHQS
ncbi:MAG: phage protein GemA/Gp16 family protein [Pseudomonadota bacterium]|nr:phage protein GemA/Gp16 family protein [Pseudomonadota bacterium]